MSTRVVYDEGEEGAIGERRKGPRSHENYRSRGRGRLVFTIEDIVREADSSLAAARKAVVRRTLDPHDLGSIIAWVNAVRAREPRRRSRRG